MKINPFDKYLKPEQKMQASVINWFMYQYPESLIFGLNLEGKKSAFERYINSLLKGNAKGLPDLFIPECKLFIELKAQQIYKKDGTLRKNDHVEEQEATMEKLRSFGYVAEFACSLEEAINIINKYMKN